MSAPAARRSSNAERPDREESRLNEAKLIIGGAHADAEGGAVYERLEPVSERLATRAASASPNDARSAANAAAAAFPV